MQNLKPIRSFVRREGRMSENQKRAINLYWESIGIDLQDEPIDLNNLFNRPAKKILDIGFGMGHSLIEAAMNNPDIDYVGVEVYRPGIGTLLDAVAKNSIKNIKIFNADVIEVLKTSIPDLSLDTVQIFFPDPWPKKRHHKRRLVQLSFIEVIYKKLKENGQLHLVSDWEDYASHMQNVLSSSSGFRNLIGDKNFLDENTDRPTTKYEQRGKRLGHQIYEMIYVKNT